MALPLWMVHKLQMRLAQKLGLAAVFCLALITIALEILRVVKSVASLRQNASTATPQYAEVTLYTTIEVSLNAWISSLPTYKSLFDKESKVRKWLRPKPKLHECPRCGYDLGDTIASQRSTLVPSGSKSQGNTSKVTTNSRKRDDLRAYGMV